MSATLPPGISPIVDFSMSYTRLSAPRRLFFSLAFGLLWSAALLGGGAAHAQRPVGQWELIAPGTTALRLVEANNAVYVAGAYGLFKYDLTDNSVRVLSKQDGLAGVVVAALAYDETTGLIVIGYRDANIDLLDPRTNRIVNVADVERRTIVGAKSINNIATHDGQAFLACTFGIVVLDLRRFEIVDSYVGLDNGQNISIGSMGWECWWGGARATCSISPTGRLFWHPFTKTRFPSRASAPASTSRVRGRACSGSGQPGRLGCRAWRVPI